MTDTPDAEDASDAVLARLYPSQPRRVIGVTILAALGVLVMWIALWHPPESFLLRLFLLAMAAAALALAVAMWQATRNGLVLTARELRDTAGERLALVAEMEAIGRGTFAFKPSQGFVLRLATAPGRRWRPGLWWRVGRSLGVGGVTPRVEGRFMAETIDMMIRDRTEGRVPRGRLPG